MCHHIDPRSLFANRRGTAAGPEL